MLSKGELVSPVLVGHEGGGFGKTSRGWDGNGRVWE